MKKGSHGVKRASTFQQSAKSVNWSTKAWEVANEEAAHSAINGEVNLHMNHKIFCMKETKNLKIVHTTQTQVLGAKMEIGAFSTIRNGMSQQSH